MIIYEKIRLKAEEHPFALSFSIKSVISMEKSFKFKKYGHIRRRDTKAVI